MTVQEEEVRNDRYLGNWLDNPLKRTQQVAFPSASLCLQSFVFPVDLDHDMGRKGDQYGNGGFGSHDLRIQLLNSDSDWNSDLKVTIICSLKRADFAGWAYLWDSELVHFHELLSTEHYQPALRFLEAYHLLVDLRIDLLPEEVLV